MKERAEIAVEKYKCGLNCCQSVVAAYADKYDIDEDTALKIGASFGGGIGGMRETCGAACGMFLLAGYEHVNNKTQGNNYKTVQLLAEEFTKRNGALKCAELLELRRKNNIGDGNPSKVTCKTMVENAVKVYEDYLNGELNQPTE